MKHSGFMKHLLRDAGITWPYTSCCTYLGKITVGMIAAAPSPGLVSQLSITPVLLRAQERQKQSREQAQQAPPRPHKRSTRLCVNSVLEASLPHQLLWDQDPSPSPFPTAPPHSLSSSGSSMLSTSLGSSPYLITATKLL